MNKNSNQVTLIWSSSEVSLATNLRDFSFFTHRFPWAALFLATVSSESRSHFFFRSLGCSNDWIPWSGAIWDKRREWGKTRWEGEWTSAIRCDRSEWMVASFWMIPVTLSARGDVAKFNPVTSETWWRHWRQSSLCVGCYVDSADGGWSTGRSATSYPTCAQVPQTPLTRCTNNRATHHPSMPDRPGLASSSLMRQEKRYVNLETHIKEHLEKHNLWSY
jgi:hypothetical protein